MQADTGTKPNAAAPEAILHPGSRHLFSYWNGLRRDRDAPGRQEIELRALAPILPWLGIVERQARPRRHRWRLAGTGIGRLWGSGLTGAAVAADWPEVYRHALVRALDGVCERRQPFVARLKATSAEGEVLGIELFAAPVEQTTARRSRRCAACCRFAIRNGSDTFRWSTSSCRRSPPSGWARCPTRSAGCKGRWHRGSRSFAAAATTDCRQA
jgi:hypothetical protein